MAGFGYAKRVNRSGGSVSGSSSSKSSGRVPANSYGTGDKYAGGSTFTRPDGTQYDVSGTFVSPGGKVSEISGGTITTISSNKNPSLAGTVYSTSGVTSPNIVTNPNTGGGSLEQLLAQQLSSTQSSLAAQRRAEEEALRAAQGAQKTAVSNSYKQSLNNVNSQTEEALRQAYINAMLQERDFPQQAALLGEGGFAESNLASLRNQAQENRNQIEMQRASQVGSLESDYNTQLAGIESAGIGQLANIGNTYASALASAESNYQNSLYGLLLEQAKMQQERELAAINAASNSGGQTTRKTSINDLYNAHDYYTATGDTAGANAIKRQINDYLGVTASPGPSSQFAGRGYLSEVEEQLSMFNSAQAAANYLASLYNQGALNDSEIAYLQARIR